MTMLLDHYGLKEPPFGLTPHTEFFFSGGERGPILDALLYAIEHEDGIVQVAGEVGTGKTLDASELAEEFDSIPTAEGSPTSPIEPNHEALRHLQSAHQVHLDDILRTWERAYVDAALKLAQGNVSQAARLLGMQRTTLYHRLAALGRDTDTR